MKKTELIEKLNEMGIEASDKIKYGDLQKMYWTEKKQRQSQTVDEMLEELPDRKMEVDLITDPEPMTVRERLINEIVEFVDYIKANRITHLDHKQLTKMFQLYNNYYNRHDSPKCSMCVGNVANKMKLIHKKFKK